MTQSVWLGRAHLAVGVASLVTFVVTGQVMDRQHAHLAGFADGPRMLFRSAHIYLLLSGALNLLLGLYLRPAAPAWRAAVQIAGSLLLLAAPPLFVLAFAHEPWLPDLVRPYARPAIYGVLAGALLHAAARLGAASEVR